MNKYFKIGEIAEAKGYTINTLRYYDKIGLVRPVYVDPETNYRYYSSQQLYQLEVIKYLKKLGISNGQLLKLCYDEDIDGWDQFMSGLSHQLQRKIDLLIHDIARIGFFRNRIEYLKKVNEKDGIYYNHFDARYIIERECHSLPTMDETIGEFTALYKDVANFSLSNTFQSGAMLSCNENLSHLEYEKIYVEVNISPEFAKVPNHRVLPAGLYICINNNLVDREEKSEILLNYVRSIGITPAVITEEYIFTNLINYDNPHMALQMLVGT